MADSSFGPTDALVGVIMGSRNDWETMKAAAEVLDELQIANERCVVSAHRTPARMVETSLIKGQSGFAGASHTVSSAERVHQSNAVKLVMRDQYHVSRKLSVTRMKFSHVLPNRRASTGSNPSGGTISRSSSHTTKPPDASQPPRCTALNARAPSGEP